MRKERQCGSTRSGHAGSGYGTGYNYASKTNDSNMFRADKGSAAV
jgi:hypothetical protein